MAKRFINGSSSIVQESLDGLVRSTPNLTRLDGYPDIKVVVRSDWDKDAGRVAVICGGGSGHEPAFAGFVGEGFLSAAVCGNIFASPSQEAVLAAIVAVSGPAGCLLVCMNYTGDRFCFGIAAARAKNEYGLNVKLLVVSDDVAIADAKQPRGLAGTLFVLKVAGAAAAAGATLDSVEAEAAVAACNVHSLGVSFSSCTLPGTGKPREVERMASDEMEVGLGIHGEPGFEKMKLGTADEISKLIADRLLTKLSPGTNCAMMVNNLGSVPPMEMGLMTKSLLTRMGAKLLVGPAHLMTSLDMNGIQVSILQLMPNMEHRLLAPTAARAWPAAVAPQAPVFLPVPLRPPPAAEANPVRDSTAEATIQRSCEALMAAASELNELDAKVGDGDCGNTLKQSAEAVLAILPRISTANPKVVFSAIARELGTVGGSSGVLLSIMFSTMAGVMSEGVAWEREALAAAFAEGVASIMRVGGSQPGSRTMVDVLFPVSEAVSQGTPAGDIVAIANQKADASSLIKATDFGRSHYLSQESLLGSKDPGCVAAAIVFRAIFN